jgi:hypothetical protein
MTDILDGKCKKTNLEEIAKSADHLPNSEQKSLLKLLKKHEDLFEGTLGTFTSKSCHVKLKDEALSRFQRFRS